LILTLLGESDVGGKFAILSALVLLGAAPPKVNLTPVAVTKTEVRDGKLIQCQVPQIVLHKPGLATNSTYYNSGMPPERFRANNKMTVEFLDPVDIQRECGGGAMPVCGLEIKACVKSGKVIMPNPCKMPGEYFARLFCHELAHTNKWPVTHGD
jgi:hypothetical protein